MQVLAVLSDKTWTNLFVLLLSTESWSRPQALRTSLVFLWRCGLLVEETSDHQDFPNYRLTGEGHIQRSKLAQTLQKIQITQGSTHGNTAINP